MKSLLRSFLINTAAIFFTSQLITGLSYNHQAETLFLSGAALTLVNLLVKPVIKLLTLPINLLTLGIFSWAVDILMLFIVTLLVPGFTVSGFQFYGFNVNGLVLPPFYVSTLLGFVSSSVAISFTSSFLTWLSR